MDYMTDGKMRFKYTLECKICGGKADGPHFGAVSCKACAAFFRRTVSQDIAHFCKTGSNECVTDQTIAPRLWCRKCRYLKCIRNGMDTLSRWNAVYTIFFIISCVQPKRDTILSGKIVKDRSSSFRKEYLLKKLVSNYKFLGKSRKAKEDAIPNIRRNRVIGSGKMKGCRVASMIELNQAFQSSVPCIIEFINTSFPDFISLSQEEKTMLLEPFLIIMFGIDNSYRTYRKVSKEQYQTISVMGETFYFDLRDMDPFLADCPATALLKSDIKKFTLENIRKKKKRIINFMGDMEIQEEEYVALMGLMLWSPRIDASTPNIDRIGRKIRNEIFEQLHYYYTTKKSMLNYAQRLGELVTLQSVVLQELISFKEDMELFCLLDAFGKELYFYNLIRNARI